jgi:hypothetical protein
MAEAAEPVVRGAEGLALAAGAGLAARKGSAIPAMESRMKTDRHLLKWVA